MSFWSDVETALSNAAKAAEADILAAAKFFEPLIQASATELAQVALQSVLQQAPLVISGAEKFSAATSSVMTNLATTGKQVAITDAQIAVQAAYNKVSSMTSPAVPPITP